jgi:hypothetical protein
VGLELDEAWSFVGRKAEKRWLPAAMCRRTRQIVAFVIGDRSAKTCARLRSKIPSGYRQCQSFSDFWKAYGPSLRPLDPPAGRQDLRRGRAHGAFLLMRSGSGWRGMFGRRSHFRSPTGCISWSRSGSSPATTKSCHLTFSHPLVNRCDQGSEQRNRAEGQEAAPALL